MYIHTQHRQNDYKSFAKVLFSLKLYNKFVLIEAQGQNYGNLKASPSMQQTIIRNTCTKIVYFPCQIV